ncbi:efflux RND transporter periplasmic adaptor subunit [Chitinasiproducens palmae]|uniref:Membrane fusion protein, macrolide-specific efflux system n=1 Tax=Chitinasiproducens palmae TaxID=1770053 RepID=A0A1H2PLL8_9BURK|nr:efflux RND transporter periplasmic adaptor subunit [Chitinasiproducens palmae]SDV47388.1 membrane fusion protein, macrolide-specific efflux system [Chitinasiproducens palmae]
MLAAAACVALASIWLRSKPAQQYLSAPVQRGDLERVVLATGTLQAYRQVDVGAQVSGQLKTLKVALGDTVRQGQWLAEIDPVIPRNALRQAQSNVARLLAERRATAARLTRAAAGLRRHRRLRDLDSTSGQEFDAARAERDVERANLAALDAQIGAARIEVESARASLGYTRIVAPIDGRVVAVVTQEGQTVIAQQQAPVILKLADLDTMTVKAQISEADVIRVRPGQTVYFTILGEPDTRHYARLRAIEPAPQNILEVQNPVGGSTRPSTAVFYNALFEVPNPDHRLRIAMTAQVGVLLGAARGVLTVPVGALGAPGVRDDRHPVRVLDAAGEVSTRWVRTGMDDGTRVEVRDGLREGERVVIDTPDDPEPDVGTAA